MNQLAPQNYDDVQCASFHICGELYNFKNSNYINSCKYINTEKKKFHQYPQLLKSLSVQRSKVMALINTNTPKITESFVQIEQANVDLDRPKNIKNLGKAVDLVNQANQIIFNDIQNPPQQL